MLVQLPVPDQLSEVLIANRIDPLKDVDGFAPVNLGRLVRGEPGAVPCTPAGVMWVLDRAGVPLEGATAVVVGRSLIVGKPMALLLIARSATVTVAHSRTKDLPALCRTADILVAAVGRPEMIRGDWIKPGAAVVDVGINRTDAGLRGDVATAEAAEVAGWITPVPGGVGPMTIAYLLKNTLDAARRRVGDDITTGDE
jgi:methylenetetrahydrofolate dehydrogenase (NADP+)/methenyltetrahydrofolate cyclohydrolase